MTSLEYSKDLYYAVSASTYQYVKSLCSIKYTFKNPFEYEDPFYHDAFLIASCASTKQYTRTTEVIEIENIIFDLAKKKKYDFNKRDKQGNTALMLSIMYSTGIKEKLLNEPNINLNYTNQSGQNILHIIARVGVVNNHFSDNDGQYCMNLIQNAIKEKRVALNLNDLLEKKDKYQKTPLMQAAFSNNPEVVKSFLDLGANIHATDESGVNALVASLMNNNQERLGKCLETQNLLLSHGINYNVKIDKKHTIFFYASFELCQSLLEKEDIDLSLIKEEIEHMEKNLSLLINNKDKYELLKTRLPIIEEKQKLNNIISINIKSENNKKLKI